MIYFLTGPEDFLAHKKTEELRKKFFKKYPEAVSGNYDLAEAEDLPKAWERLSQGGGLFCSASFIVVHNVLALKKNEADRLLALLEERVRQEREIVVVVRQKDLKDKKHPVYIYLNKYAAVEEYKRLEGLKLRVWMDNEVKDLTGGKVSLATGAIDNLMLFYQNDMWRLYRELEKVLTYKEEGILDQQDVDILCQGHIQTKIFDLIDAIVIRQKARAYKLLYQLIDQGQSEIGIFSMVMYQFRNLAKISDAQKHGIIQPEVLAKKLQLHPFVVKKSIAQMRNFPMEKLKKIYELACLLDSQIKLGQKDAQDALVYFIAKI
jgi:DNA polymerase-3 subunit delta